jgi:hypothetical protein
LHKGDSVNFLTAFANNNTLKKLITTRTRLSSEINATTAVHPDESLANSLSV